VSEYPNAPYAQTTHSIAPKLGRTVYYDSRHHLFKKIIKSALVNKNRNRKTLGSAYRIYQSNIRLKRTKDRIWNYTEILLPFTVEHLIFTICLFNLERVSGAPSQKSAPTVKGNTGTNIIV